MQNILLLLFTCWSRRNLWGDVWDCVTSLFIKPLPTGCSMHWWFCQISSDPMMNTKWAFINSFDIYYLVFYHKEKFSFLLYLFAYRLSIYLKSCIHRLLFYSLNFLFLSLFILMFKLSQIWPMSFWHVLITFWRHPCHLAQKDVPVLEGNSST